MSEPIQTPANEGSGNVGAGIWLIVRRSLRQHLLSTAITVISAALACGLVISVFAIQFQTRNAFTGGPVGFDAVLGARGSQLQLVLNTVFHLETSPGNIPWSLYRSMEKHPMVKLAIPYAVGDNYHGYRVVGTTDQLFTDFEYTEGKKLEVARGRLFDPLRQEAVVGSFVAEKLGLKVGGKIRPFHGLTFDPTSQHEEEYLITGIMAPSNSPSDRVIWIPIEGIFRMEGHVLRGTGETYMAQSGREIPDEHKEVSAVMLKFRGGPMAGQMLNQTINRQGKVATLAWPIANVVADLFDKLGWANRVLALVAYLVIVVAAGSILASIYNTINERKRTFAILRALGARKRVVFTAIVMEATAIATLGALLGYAVYAVILSGVALIVREQTGVVINVWEYHPVLIAGPLGMIALGALAGVVPAIKAYSTDVAKNLMPVS